MTRELPVLELRPDCLGNPTKPDLGMIEAVMLFPDDQEKRREFQISVGVETARGLLVRGFLDPVLLDGFALYAPGSIPLPQINEAAQPRFRDGVIAGALLKNAIGAASYRHERLKMDHVRNDVARAAFGKRITGDGRNAGEKTIQNESWPKFRCVSHFWAAYLDACERRGPESPFPCDIQEVGHFLASAGAFLAAGASTRFKGARSTILNRAECVAVPPLAGLPKATILLENHDKVCQNMLGKD